MATTNRVYTANTGMTTISTANPNLNGTGTIATVLTAANDGTIVKNVYIKATGNTSQGMVRFYINDSGTDRLTMEIAIPASVQTGVEPAFEVFFDANLTLQTGQSLTVSTQNADTFNIIADGTDWQNCDCS